MVGYLPARERPLGSVPNYSPERVKVHEEFRRWDKGQLECCGACPADSMPKSRSQPRTSKRY